MFFSVILLLCALSAGGFAAPLKVNITEDDPKSQSSFLTPHIVGGSPVNTPIKYQVSLRAQINQHGSLDASNLKHFCGGSLILPNVVLTAAHCFYDKIFRLTQQGRIYAVAGTNLKEFKPSTTFVSQVQSVIKHPSYSDFIHNNDVAVLKIRNAAPNNIYIGPIVRRSKPSNVRERCLISGWGTMQFGEEDASEILRAATVPILDRAACSIKYNVLGYTLTPDMMCAGEEQGGVDTCQGDSGGPLVCNGELTGVVSWGYKCGAPGVPGVYASVAYFRQWIDDSIKELDVMLPPTPQPSVEPTRPGSSARKCTMDILTYVLILTVIITRMSIRQF